LLKPHAHGHGHAPQEALPRAGIAIIGGLLAYAFLLAPLGHLVGIEVGGHGAATHGEPPSAAALWTLKAVVFALGAAAGWFIAATFNRLAVAFFKGFNWTFDKAIHGYGLAVKMLIRLTVVSLAVYAVLMGLTVVGFNAVPVGFIPEQDKGYLVLNAQLPDGASLERTDKLIRELSEIIRNDEAVDHTLDLPGYSAVLGTNISNVGGMFIILKPFEERAGIEELSAPAVARRLRQKFAERRESLVGIFGAPPVEGLGSTGGFKLQVQDIRSAGLPALQGSVSNLADEGNRDPRLAGLFTSFSVTQPQLFVEFDEEKARSM
jgi:multidrug efflux pump subunit AcrB